MKRFCMIGLLALAASAVAQPTATLSEGDRRALDRAAALGVGLLEEGRRPPAPAAPRSNHDQFAREQNQRTGERLQQTYDAAVARCGGPLPVLPSVGMTLQRVFDCTQAGHFSGVDQIVELRLDGRRLQLYISQRSDVGRLYFVDGVLMRMDP
ncbi:hypothetical protein [Roseateles sp. LYH14W]|uniref:Uncharacterized protein n=1 Tax=Pelomonas parva TaxID=3299032 RepID=A0ABW7EZR0_9BURK